MTTASPRWKWSACGRGKTIDRDLALLGTVGDGFGHAREHLEQRQGAQLQRIELERVLLGGHGDEVRVDLRYGMKPPRRRDRLAQAAGTRARRRRKSVSPSPRTSSQSESMTARCSLARMRDFGRGGAKLGQDVLGIGAQGERRFVGDFHQPGAERTRHRERPAVRDQLGIAHRARHPVGIERARKIEVPLPLREGKALVRRQRCKDLLARPLKQIFHDLRHRGAILGEPLPPFAVAPDAQLLDHSAREFGEARETREHLVGIEIDRTGGLDVRGISIEIAEQKLTDDVHVGAADDDVGRFARDRRHQAQHLPRTFQAPEHDERDIRREIRSRSRSDGR